MMEFLPEEVLLMICKHLTGKDLASLCATNHCWRNIINADVFWRRRFDPETAEYLAKTECVVEPGFVNPEVEGTGLSNICEFRLSYMRQNHLENNWRQGRFKRFDLSPKMDFYNQTGDCCLFYGNDLVITNSLPKHALYAGFSIVELWDVKTRPILISEMDILLACAQLGDVNTQSLIQVSGNSIVIWDADLVHVLQITPKSKKLQFKHAFYYHQAKKTTKKVKSYSNYFKNVGNYSQAVLIDSTFLGTLKKPTQEKLLHIWNVETGDKLKEETYENCAFVELFRADASQNNETVLVVQQNKSTFKVVIYNVTQLAFNSFVLTKSEVPYDCKLNGQFIAIHTSENVGVYNVETSELVKNLPTMYMTLLTTLENSFIFVGNNGLMQFNTSTEEVQLVFESKTLIELVEVFYNKLILFTDRSCLLNFDKDQTKLLLLKRDNTKVVRTVEVSLYNIQCSNRLCSKLLLYTECDMKKLLHFW